MTWGCSITTRRRSQSDRGSSGLGAETAERWGWLNRALGADEIHAYVNALARRIANFPPEAVRLAKQAIDAAALPLAEGCRIEGALFQTLLFSGTARTKMARFLELGGQTREGELRVATLSAEVASDWRPYNAQHTIA